MVIPIALRRTVFVTTLSSSSGAPDRVAEAFARFGRLITDKEGIPAPDLELSFRAVARDRMAGGALATLWVGGSERVRSTFYHVDVASPDGVTSTGFGACSVAGASGKVSLGRAGSIVVGSVDTHLAHAAAVTTRYGTVTVTVAVAVTAAAVGAASGYFLVPSRLNPGGDVMHAITLIGDDGAVLGSVTGLPAPGSATISFLSQDS